MEEYKELVNIIKILNSDLEIRARTLLFSVALKSYREGQENANADDPFEADDNFFKKLNED